MDKKHFDKLMGIGLDITQQSVLAAWTLLKASPWILVIWIVFIAPNC